MSKTAVALEDLITSDFGIETTVTKTKDNDANGKEVDVLISQPLPGTEGITLNLMATEMKLGLVKKHTYGEYLTQIKHNLLIHGKAMFLVCRDLYDAKVNLIKVEKSIDQQGKEQEVHKTEEFDQLVRELKISDSTLKKYLAIGSFKPFLTMFNKGLLPNKWTTLYHITTLTKDQQGLIINKLNNDITVPQINKICGAKGVKSPSDMISIVKVEVNKSVFDTSTGLKDFKEYIDKVLTKAFAKYENTDNVKVTYNERLDDICRRLENKNKPKVKSPASAAKQKEKEVIQRNFMKDKEGALDTFMA